MEIGQLKIREKALETLDELDEARGRLFGTTYQFAVEGAEPPDGGLGAGLETLGETLTAIRRLIEGEVQVLGEE